LAGFPGVLGTSVQRIIAHHGLSRWGMNTFATNVYQLSVEPGDTSIERGTSLLVLARFSGHVPGDVQLISTEDMADSAAREVPMSKSLNDPVFAARVPALNRDLQYAVKYGGSQTRWFKASVCEYPDLKQADAHLAFPHY